MANTSPFCIPSPGINVANNLLVNSVELLTAGLVANSQGLNVSTVVNTTNVHANNFSGNNGNFLSLIANLISMNVISGNIATLVNCTSNQYFINSISGNNTTGFLNITANRAMMNSLSGNTMVCTNVLFTNVFATSSISVGNSTFFVKVQANSTIFGDSAIRAANSARGVEVILKKGSVSAQSVTINFEDEVSSNAYKSMKLIMSNMKASQADVEWVMQYCTQSGGTPNTSSIYRRSYVGVDSQNHQSYDDTSSSDSITIVRTANSDAQSGFTATFMDTTTNSKVKVTMIEHSHAALLADREIVQLTGGWTSSRCNLKGVKIWSDNGTWTGNWALIGYRF
jgi:hypothetical protein